MQQRAGYAQRRCSISSCNAASAPWPPPPPPAARAAHAGLQRCSPAATRGYLPLVANSARRGPAPPAAAAGGSSLEALLAGLRADPALAPLLDDPRVAAAVREVAADPGALRRYEGDAKVLSVLRRLLERDMAPAEGAAYESMGTTPLGALRAMTSDPELTALLALPKVKAALADARRDPEHGLDRWAGDAEVQRALDLLEAALGQQGAGGGGGVIDVAPR